MFDSLDNGFMPICIIVVICAWYIAMVRNSVLRIGIALILPIVISFGWFFVPRIDKLFTKLKFGEDPWVSWGIIAAISWSTVAVPLSVVAVVVFVLIKRRKEAISLTMKKNEN